MFLKSILPVGFLIMSLTQCTHTDETPASGLNKAFSLAKGEVATLALGTSDAPTSDKLLFHLVTIEDSRCPANANCIWAGEAKTDVELEVNGQKVQASLKLSAAATSRADSATVVVGARSFVVLLKEVTPYPGLTPPASTPASKASFIVK